MKFSKVRAALGVTTFLAIASVMIGYQNCGKGFVSTIEAKDVPSEIRAQAIMVGANKVQYFTDLSNAAGTNSNYHAFVTYVHLLNIHGSPQTVRVRLRNDAGQEVRYDTVVCGGCRRSVNLADMLAGRGPAGKWAAEIWGDDVRHIFASATTYNSSWQYRGWENSKTVNAIAEPRNKWVFGEGGTYAYGPTNNRAIFFDHFFTLYNPNNHAITVHFALNPDQVDGAQKYPGIPYVGYMPIHIPPRTRREFNPLLYQNIEGSHAATLWSNEPGGFVAQMTMYATNHPAAPNRMPNMQSAIGSVQSTRWMFVNIPNWQHPTPGINTGWHNRFYIMNENNAKNRVTWTYRNAAGQVQKTFSAYIMPYRRMGYDMTTGTDDNTSTYHVTGQEAPPLPAPALGGDNMSLELTATHPISVTKINYWGKSWNWAEGAMTNGSYIPTGRLAMPSGSTGIPTYVHLVNMSNATATVACYVYISTGILKGFYITIPPNGMRQLHTSEILAGHNYSGDFGMVFDSNQAIGGETSSFGGWQPELNINMWSFGDSSELIPVNDSWQPIY